MRIICAAIRRAGLLAAALAGALCGFIYAAIVLAFALLATAYILLRLLFELPAVVWNSMARRQK